MDTPNIFKEDTDINIVKSWLCDSTEGQTYSLSARFLPRIKIPEGLDWDFCDIEAEWDEIIGWKHDYKVDDPEMEKKAEETLANINSFIERVNAKPQKYFKEVKKERKNEVEEKASDKVYDIIHKAQLMIVDEMEKAGIKFDSQSIEDCIFFFFDDTEQKKSFCITISMEECAEYYGEE